MSWAVSEWKDGLPSRALQKIEELEQQLEKLKRERLQKQCQMDTLEQALEKQKRKLEEDRVANARTVKENQALLDSCEELERKRQKVEHDLQTKESYVACLEGQLSHSKQATDAEMAKVAQLKLELNRSLANNQTITVRVEKLAADNARLQELCNHQRKQVDDQREQLTSLQFSLKQSGGSSISGPRPTLTALSLPGSDAAEVNKFQEKIVELESLLASAVDEKQQAASLLHQLQESVHREGEKDQVSSDIQQKFTSNISSVQPHLNVNQCVSTSRVNDALTNVADKQLSLPNQQMGKSAADGEGMKKTIDNLKHQLEESVVKLQMAEEKAKKMQLEAECHRHNAESIRLSIDQKLKEKEKDFRLDLSHLQDTLKDCEGRLAMQSANSQKEINKLSAECESLRSQLDKVTQKSAEQEKQISSQRDRVSSVDNLVAEHQKAVASFELHVKELNVEKTQQVTSLVERDNQILKLKSEIQSLNDRIKVADQSNDEIRGRMLEYQLESESLRACVDDKAREQESLLSGLNAEIELLKTNINEMTDKLSVESFKHKELSGELDALRSECTSLKQLLSEKETLFCQMTERRKSLDDQLECLKQTHEEVVVELTNLRTSSTDLIASKELDLERISNDLTKTSQELEQTQICKSSIEEKCLKLELCNQQMQETTAALEMAQACVDDKARKQESLLSGLNAEIELLKTNINEMTDKLSVESFKHKELSGELDTQRSKCTSLMQLLSEKETLFCQTTERCKSLEDQLECLKQTHAEVVVELTNLRTSSTDLIASKELDLERISNDLTRTSQELEQTQICKSSIEEKCLKLELCNQQLQETIVALEMAQACVDDKAREQESLLSGLNVEIELLKSNITEMTDKLSVESFKHNELSGELDTQRSECTSLKQLLSEKETLFCQMTERCKSLDDQLECLKQTHEDLRTSSTDLIASKELDLERISNDLTRTNQELEQIQVCKSSIDEKCLKLELCNQQMQETIAALEMAQVNQESALKERERDVEELHEELELLQSVNRLADQGNRKLQDIVQQNNNKVQSIELKHLSMSQEYETVICKLKEEIKSLKCYVDQGDQVQADVRRKLVDCQQDLSSVKVQNDHLTNILEDLERKLESVSSENSNLLLKLDASNKVIDKHLDDLNTQRIKNVEEKSEWNQLYEQLFDQKTLAEDQRDNERRELIETKIKLQEVLTDSEARTMILDSEVNQLNNILQQKTAQVTRLEMELDQKVQQILDDHVEKENLNESLLRLSTELENCQTQVDSKTVELEKLCANIEEMSNEQIRMNQLILAVTEQKEVLEVQLKIAYDHLEDVRKQVTDIHKTGELLQSTLRVSEVDTNTSHIELAELKNKSDYLLNQLNSTEIELEATNQKYIDLQKMVELLQNKQHMMESEKYATDMVLSELRKKIDCLQSELDMKTDELATSNKKCSEAHETVELLQNTLNRIELEKIANDEKLDELRKEMQSKLDMKQVELEATKQKCVDVEMLQKTAGNLEDEIKSRDNALIEMRKKTDCMQSLIDSGENELVAANQKCVDLQQLVQSLQTALRKSEVEKKTSDEVHTKLEHKIECIQSQLNSKDAELADSNKRHIDSLKAMEFVQNTLTHLQVEKSACDKVLTELGEKVINLQSLLDVKEVKLVAANKKHSDSIQMIDLLNSKVTNLELEKMKDQAELKVKTDSMLNQLHFEDNDVAIVNTACYSLQTGSGILRASENTALHECSITTQSSATCVDNEVSIKEQKLQPVGDYKQKLINSIPTMSELKQIADVVRGHQLVECTETLFECTVVEKNAQVEPVKSELIESCVESRRRVRKPFVRASSGISKMTTAGEHSAMVINATGLEQCKRMFPDKPSLCSLQPSQITEVPLTSKNDTSFTVIDPTFIECSSSTHSTSCATFIDVSGSRFISDDADLVDQTAADQCKVTDDSKYYNLVSAERCKKPEFVVKESESVAHFREDLEFSSSSSVLSPADCASNYQHQIQISSKRASSDGDSDCGLVKKYRHDNVVNSSHSTGITTSSDSIGRLSLSVEDNRLAWKSRIAAKLATGTTSGQFDHVTAFNHGISVIQNTPLATITNSPCKVSSPATGSSRETLRPVTKGHSLARTSTSSGAVSTELGEGSITKAISSVPSESRQNITNEECKVQ